MNWQTTATIIGVIVGVTTLIGVFVKKVLPAIRVGARIADKVTGVPANPITGQTAVPGLFERLDHQDGVLETIRHEVEFNNGTSVKDAVTRVENGQRDLNDLQAEQSKQLTMLAAQLQAHILTQTDANIAAAAAVVAGTTINVHPGLTHE